MIGLFFAAIYTESNSRIGMWQEGDSDLK